MRTLSMKLTSILLHLGTTADLMLPLPTFLDHFDIHLALRRADDKKR